jgi:hypothetical protein
MKSPIGSHLPQNEGKIDFLILSSGVTFFAKASLQIAYRRGNPELKYFFFEFQLF